MSLPASRTLNIDVAFVRVDRYELEHRMVFGELTNYPSAGKMGDQSVELDGVPEARPQVPGHHDSFDLRG